MGHPPTTQQTEKSEETLACLHASIRSTVTEEVSAAVKGAMAAMEQLSDRFIRSFDETFKRQELHLDEATNRLEGRVNQAREHQQMMINMMKDDQLKFQAEVRATLSELKSHIKAPAKHTEVHPNCSGLSMVGRSETGVEASQMYGRMGKGLLFGEGSNGGKSFGGGPERGTQGKEGEQTGDIRS
ncbi:hypothetical protein AgCh_010002 [Apium graveolens]